MKKEHPIIMLPSEKSYIHLSGGKLYLEPEIVTRHKMLDEPECVPQQLYILSDEEIKDGDCHLHFYKGEAIIGQSFGNGVKVANEAGYKKIIATTDTELIESGVSEIPTNIVKAYVKAYNEGKPFDKVMVEYESFNSHVVGVTRPKLNPDGTLCVSLVEEKIEVDKLKLIEELERLRLTSDEELRTRYPIKPNVGMGIDWDKWIKENL
jgi:hypothetical protein